MTGAEQQPSVSTAPAEGASSSATVSPAAPLRGRRLPPHIGPARTSTVLLAALFLAIGLLYLFVKPEPSNAAGTTTDPASTSRQTERTSEAPNRPPSSTPAPTSEPAPLTAETTPEETTAPKESTTEAPESSTEDTGTTTPEESTAPTSEPAPSTAAPSS